MEGGFGPFVRGFNSGGGLTEIRVDSLRLFAGSLVAASDEAVRVGLLIEVPH
jgi:hypothetical protein